MNDTNKTKTTVARYLVQRLKELGLDHSPGTLEGRLSGV